MICSIRAGTPHRILAKKETYASTQGNNPPMNTVLAKTNMVRMKIQNGSMPIVRGNKQAAATTFIPSKITPPSCKGAKG